MANLSGLPNLEILSLGRNLLKRFDALDGVSATLRELWVSYNQIDKVVRPWQQDHISEPVLTQLALLLTAMHLPGMW